MVETNDSRPLWAAKWDDGQGLAALSNLAVRAYAAACRGGQTLYEVDDAPYQDDGMVDLWTRREVPAGFPEALLVILETQGKFICDGVTVTLDDDVLRFSLNRTFQELSKEELLGLTVDSLVAMAHQDQQKMDDACRIVTLKAQREESMIDLKEGDGFVFVDQSLGRRVYVARGNNWYGSEGGYDGGPWHADGGTKVLKVWVNKK